MTPTTSRSRFNSVIELSIVYTVLCVCKLPAIASDEDVMDTQGQCITGECDAATDADAELRAPPESSQAVPAPTEDQLPTVPDVGVAENGVLNIDIIQQIADTVFKNIERFLPPDVAEQLRGKSVFVLAAMVAVTLLLLIGTLRLLRSSLKVKSVLLCGPMGAGKTTLFHALQGNTLPNGTVTSMQASETLISMPGKGKKLKVVDAPGHPRLRSAFNERASAAAGVVFMLDSSSFIADKHAVAGHLYEVLRQLAAFSGKKKPLLLACNKADLGERAFSQEFIVRQLEKEMTTFRASYHAGLAPGKSKGAAGDGLCSEDAKLSLATISVPVQVCSTSALTSDMSAVHTFLSRLQ